MNKFVNFRIFFIALLLTTGIVCIKYLLHSQEWEVIALSSLHGSVI